MRPFEYANNTKGNIKNTISNNVSLKVNFTEPRFSFGFKDKSFKSGNLVRDFTLYKNDKAPVLNMMYAIVSISSSIMIFSYYV